MYGDIHTTKYQLSYHRFEFNNRILLPCHKPISEGIELLVSHIVGENSKLEY